MPRESGHSHNPVSEGNPFRKRGIDPDTGEPVIPKKPGEFVGEYLGPDAAKAVDELVGSDKAGSGSKVEKDLEDLLTPEEQEATRQTEEREIVDLLPNLAEQYKAQVEILQNRGYLITLEGGKEGIVDIKGTEHALPTLQEVAERLVDRSKETKGALTTKLEQGFTKLVIVPFGMALKKHIELHGQTILDHDTKGTLKGANGDTLDDLSTTQPIWTWDELTKDRGADVEGTMVYNSKVFDKDKHGGVTKAELLKDPKEAFQILLLQEDLNIPRAGQGKTKEGRMQLEAGKSPKAYLETFTEAAKDRGNPYHLEQGLTPEDVLTLATTHLDETNQVIDDYLAKDPSNNPITSASYLTGAYLPTSDDLLPYFRYRRDDRQAGLGGYRPDNVGGSVGMRSAVRV